MIFPPSSISGNSRKLQGSTWQSPQDIGSGTPNTLEATITQLQQLFLTANGDNVDLAISWTSDPDTGFSRTATGQITYYTNGSDVMVLDSSGAGLPLGSDVGNGTNTGLKVGSGDIVYKIFKSSQSLSFTAVNNTVTEQTLTVTDVSTTDLIQLIPPNTLSAGLMFSAFASDVDEVKIRIHNTTGSSVVFTSATFIVVVFSFNEIGGGGGVA